jgi:ketosteroid isomerase-like protein
MTGAFKRSMVFVWAAGLALACQTQEPATEQGSEMSPAVDEAAVRETIETKDQAWAVAAVAGDAAAIAQQYAADAIVAPPGTPRVTGNAAIQELFTGWLAEAPISAATLDSDVITVAASGDYAHAVGSYTMSGTAPDGSEWSDQGKYVAVWENVDGDWKIVTDIWNSDNPPAGMDAGEPASADDAATDSGEPAE